MSEAVMTLLMQIPLAGVVVYVVMVFLNYLTKADERNKQFLCDQRIANNAAMEKLALEIKAVAQEVAGLKTLMIAHEARTETAISINPSTQPRRNKKDGDSER